MMSVATHLGNLSLGAPVSPTSASLLSVVSMDATRHFVVQFLTSTDVSNVCLVSVHVWACFKHDSTLWKAILIRSSHRNLARKCDGLLERLPSLKYWTGLHNVEMPGQTREQHFFYDEELEDFSSRLNMEPVGKTLVCQIHASVVSVSSLARMLLTRVPPRHNLVLGGLPSIVSAPQGMQALLSATGQRGTTFTLVDLALPDEYDMAWGDARLNYLCLENNNIQTLERFARGFAENESLEDFKVMKQAKLDCSALGQGLPRNLHTLTLSECTELNLDGLAEGIRDHKRLTLLELCGNGIRDIGALCQALQINKTIVELDLSRNLLSTCHGLGDFLRATSSLKRLTLDNNQMGEYLGDWCGALAGNSSLLFLSLENNGISSSVELAEGLRSNTRLVDLNLSCNFLRDVDCLAKVVALRSCALGALHLADNQLESCASLGKALATNIKLSTLVLDNNNVLTHGLQELLQGIVDGDNLEVLCIEDNAFNDTDLDEFFKQVEELCPRLSFTE